MERAGERYRISIHAPREGSDEIGPYSAYAIAVFLSTLPVRGATNAVAAAASSALFLSTLPVRGATHKVDPEEPAVYIDFYPRSL